MNNRIALALSKQFDRHRIVFWYDIKQELRKDFEALDIEGVEKIELNNNEFAIKYQILREQPEQKFLLYREGEQPNDLDNWLLDVQLAHSEFRTDQVAIWLADLELGIEFSELVQAHAGFFQAVKRKQKLKNLLNTDDTAGLIRLKMLAVCTSAEARVDCVLENLLADLAEGKDDKLKLLTRCQLDGFLWEQLGRYYGYYCDKPSLKDFTLELFKSCYAMGLEGDVQLSNDALVFLKRWKDSRQFETAFEQLSTQAAEDLSIEQDLSKRDFRGIIELDYFRLIDQRIITDLVHAVVARTVTSGDVALWVRQRRLSHWYGEFKHLYEAIDYAAQFIQLMGEISLTMESLTDGVERYCQSWFHLDQHYRKFIYHVRCSNQVSLMGKLAEAIEILYCNNYLLALNDRWQLFVDSTDKWNASPIPLQKNFFERYVRPFLRKDKKVYVIISDALRYEVGEEFLSLIRKEDRYEAKLEANLSMLPSYTQLGMAALLPNTSLAIADNDSGTVLVDGQSSQGTQNRTKILRAALNDKAIAIKANAFMEMHRDESRELLKANDVIYLYHNRIDHTGDKIQSEGEAFDAAERTLDDLMRLVKRLTAANASNILLTADHGFIYQHKEIDESDFAGQEVTGEQVLYRDRRFVLGKGLTPNNSVRLFRSKELGLLGDMEVAIPKSINRLRLRGSGSRFVHGGATLQEVVVPVIRINKKRQSDLSQVEVEILRGSSSVITSGQLAVRFYQDQAVTEKLQARILRAGIYTERGDLISDCHELNFDFISENTRERELQVRFVLARNADDVNQQEVILRLDEKLAGTTHFKEYKSLRYMMRRSFTSDFDF